MLYKPIPFKQGTKNIWCNNNYLKNSVSDPNGDLLQMTPKSIVNYRVSFYVGQVTKILMLL